tara:strand:- start:1764 stop:2180 length:417 start_codon:yes stop_codon:yes gene_type:complete
MEYISETIFDLEIIGKKIIKFSEKKSNIFTFEGEIGVGKTTLIKKILKNLKVKDLVKSPTFSIVNEYLTSDNKIIYHFDFFRLKNKIEVLDMGFEEYLDSSNFCFIEWPKYIQKLLPSDVTKIKMEYLDESKRKIIIE